MRLYAFIYLYIHLDNKKLPIHIENIKDIKHAKIKFNY